MFEIFLTKLKSDLDNLTRLWISEIKKSEYMEHYLSLSEGELFERGKLVYRNLIDWLASGASNDKAEHYFEGVGSNRLEEGFSLTEVNYALYKSKNLIQRYISENAEITEHLNRQKLITFLTIVSNFFDLAVFYISRGYYNELYLRLEETQKLSKEELKKLVQKGSIDKKDIDADEIIWRHI